MRILLFGDGQWAADALTKLVACGDDLVGVVVRVHPSDSSLEEAADRFDVPVHQPANVNSLEFVATAITLEPDLALSVSYNQIIRRPLLGIARAGFVNFHAGRLPRYRGRNVINWAIINGEQEIGLTSHYVDEGIDTGDIILQRTLPIGWCDTYGSVLARVVAALPDLVVQTVALIASGSPPRTPQDHSAATYYCGREEGDEWLDWADTSRNLYNKIRGITRPGPGACTLLGGDVVRVWGAQYDPTWPKYIATPGQVVGKHAGGSLIKTGDSVLLLTDVQVGDAACTVPPWRIGTRLGINLLARACSVATQPIA
ncbi:MAG TPA: methionyl-tRNA formyltransferase [Bryobacteraceae bacterium]|nr:methionyl-tRNA formyltransferase [Bryobacteraceae bacterium]